MSVSVREEKPLLFLPPLHPQRDLRRSECLLDMREIVGAGIAYVPVKETSFPFVLHFFCRIDVRK